MFPEYASDQLSRNRIDALRHDIKIHTDSWCASANDTKADVLCQVAADLDRFLWMRTQQLLMLTEEMVVAAGASQQRHFADRRWNLLDAYVQEATRDWYDLKRIANQREFYGRSPARKPILAVLADAEQLATTYLAAAESITDFGDDAQPVPCCYFDKGSSILRSPYTKTPMISIPLAAIGVRSDLFAVAHEIGHFIYRYLKREVVDQLDAAVEALRQESVVRFGSDQNFRIDLWREEIFADVIAAHYSGEVYAKQFVELLLRRVGPSVENFTHDDDVHPPVALRPFAFVTPVSVPWFGDYFEPVLDAAVAERNTIDQPKHEDDDPPPVEPEVFRLHREQIMSFADTIRSLIPAPAELIALPEGGAVALTPVPIKGEAPAWGYTLEEFEEELEGWDKDLLPTLCPACMNRT